MCSAGGSTPREHGLFELNRDRVGASFCQED
jgi:hypothetical protein